ncbi:SLOG family protein [Nonomuraea indica]|uniref:SLOG family protein n=1 Tax=Nonomuraea indica TaxID=1581193 RepID=UPI000C79BC64|nr:SLOG family protein [Nonomuraea indica]
MPDRFRVLITGSRSWSDEQAIRDALAPIAFMYGPENVVVVHGACPKGADALADRVASAWTGMAVERYPAEWTAPCGPVCRTPHRRRRLDGATYCPMAGLNRNQFMVDLGADVLLAFQVDDSRGTADCIRRAEQAGIPVRRYEGSSRA